MLTPTSLMRLTTTILEAWQLLRRAASRDLTTTLLLQVLSGVMLAFQLLLGKRLLEWLTGPGPAPHLLDLAPVLLSIGLVTAAGAAAAAR